MDLRTYVLIDSMQPQYAALTGILLQGDTPVEGMAEIFMELAPASDVYEVLDAALKTTEVRPGLLRVEREYGTLEIHGFFQEDVKAAGRESLAKFGLTEADRWKPEVVSIKTVTGVDPWEAQLVNQTSRGGLLLKGQTLCVIEVVPAAYVMLAANEAEKASDAVSKAIRRATDLIGAEHPRLSRHLRDAIKRGYTLSYEPESPVLWQTN